MIDTVGIEEAKHVIAESIINDHKVNNLEINKEEVLKIEEDESVSDLSGETGQRMMQTTRDNLKEMEERIRELTV